MTTFLLPDLGEGLADAEIIEWHVQEGDVVRVDQPMISVETAKAIVEIPCPFSGIVVRQHGIAGSVIKTGQPLIDIVPDRNDSATGSLVIPRVNHLEKADGEDSPQPILDEKHATTKRGPKRVRVSPSNRKLADQLKVDLSSVDGTGREGLITMEDILNAVGISDCPPPCHLPKNSILPEGFEPLSGPRRMMARSMSISRDEVALCTLFDDADVHLWATDTDLTVRLIRAMAAGVATVPAMNAVFDSGGSRNEPSRKILDAMHLGIAVDVGDRLIVPVIRTADKKSPSELRMELDRLKTAIDNRTISPEELRDYSIVLSNFGTLTGRYATPLVVPPTVATLGAGKLRHDVVSVDGRIESRKQVPLSLSFDHRCITGGEACRFLAAVIEDMYHPT